METLTIQVNCNRHKRDGPPQLGITVEAPYSLQLRQQQAAAKDYRDHDYQNCYPSENGGLTISRHNSSNNNNNNRQHNDNSIRNNNGKQTLVNQLGEQIQKGLQITHIQPASVIDKNGQFRDAQRTLREFVAKSSHEPLILKVLRKAASSSSLPSTTGSHSTVIERNNKMSVSSSINTPPKDSNPSPASQNGARHFVGALNTRRIGTKHYVRLPKSKDGGFGIKIAERDNMFGAIKPIYITAITTTGSAYRDGRLREGDMLLEVNGIDLSGKSQPEVTKMLKSVGVNEHVDFVVSRLENPGNEGYHELNECPNNELIQSDNLVNKTGKDQSLIDLDAPDNDDSVFSETHDNQFEKKIDKILMDGPGTYVYDIPLNDTKSAGLGLYLKYPTLNRKDLGIWIEKVITGGAAWKDGRLLPDDQILAINGIKLMGLSNAEASETLTAAVCRGIGPEATANTIRLEIHRKDPSIVAKILHGTNNRIEHSDLPANKHSKSYTEKKHPNNTQDSFVTAFDATIHSRSQSSNDTSGSNKSSNQNSQNDSAMSPQTQASNSLKSTNLGNDKSDHNISDKTNDTSSAISQITDYTSVPNTDYNTFDGEPNNSDNQAPTMPKTLDSSDVTHNIEPPSSTQSWDDESIDNTISGEERFQRDGFGRQSISEKRHAQLMAQNTDTYKRNKKQREEQEKQSQLEEQFKRQSLDDQRHNINISAKPQHQRTLNPEMRDTNTSIYGRTSNTRLDTYYNNNNNNITREVPVDVQIPVEPGIETEPQTNSNQTNSKQIFQLDAGQTRIPNHLVPLHGNQPPQVLRCWKCGSYGQCCCAPYAFNQRQQMFDRYEQVLKKSNSLESVQPHEPLTNGLIIPRAGTVRVARNRKINESFRAAVDRSYEDAMAHDSSRLDFLGSDQRRSNASTKMANSIANSTTSTSNDERFLLNNSNGINDLNVKNGSSGHKKSSSLLTRFLKFGSMKKSKKKNKDSNNNSNITENLSNQQDNNSELGSNRSHTSRSTHSRTQSIQSHPNANINQARQQSSNSNQYKLGQLHYDSFKSASQTNQITNMDLHNQHRASLNMYQHQVPQNLHNQGNIQLHSKLATNYMMRPTSMINNNPQYSHPQLHHHQMGPRVNNLPQQIPQHLPADLHNHFPLQYPTATRGHLMQNPLVNMHQNGCQPNQWQSPTTAHGSNGLWVADSPATDVYGTVHPQQACMLQRGQQQQQQLPAPLTSHQLPSFMPQMNGQRANGHLIHQTPILQNLGQAIAQPHLHNQQPEHIYYYDF